MKGPENWDDLLQGLRDVPLGLQMPLYWPHVDASQWNLLFCRGEKAYQGHELSNRTTGPLQQGIDLGVYSLPSFRGRPDYSLSQIVLVAYKIENLLGHQFRFLEVHDPTQLLTQGEEGLGVLKTCVFVSCSDQPIVQVLLHSDVSCLSHEFDPLDHNCELHRSCREVKWKRPKLEDLVLIMESEKLPRVWTDRDVKVG